MERVKKNLIFKKFVPKMLKKLDSYTPKIPRTLSNQIFRIYFKNLKREIVINYCGKNKNTFNDFTDKR